MTIWMVGDDASLVALALVLALGLIGELVRELIRRRP
jgi:hypothetical protein